MENDPPSGKILEPNASRPNKVTVIALVALAVGIIWFILAQ